MSKRMLLVGLVAVGIAGAVGAVAASAAHSDTAVDQTQSTQVDYTEALDVGTAAPANNGSSRHITVVLKDVKGKKAAQVDITVLKDGTNLVQVHAWNLTPGFHAIHIHAMGVCDPAGAKPFASAGGHFNPTGKPEAMQAGAFPVLLAGAHGEANTRFVDGNFQIRDLFGAAGTAVVIHAAPDNYANIPTRYTANGVAGPDTDTQMTGDAGTRVACGVVSAPKVKPSSSPSPSAHAMPGM